jgi:DNA-binding FrmR family transcriptional regulator
MDDSTRSDAKTRLKRVAGQVGGVERMVDDDRYCIDILLQIAAIQGALSEIGRVVLSNHVQTCLADALRSGNARERKGKVDEVLDLFSRCSVIGAGPVTRRKANRQA